MNDPTRSIEPENAKDLDEPGNLPGIIALLGELKPNAIITEEGIASMSRARSNVASCHLRPVSSATIPGQLELWSVISSSVWKRLRRKPMK
jgi:hypothetical protein